MSASGTGEESERLRAFRAATEEFMKAFNEGDFELAFAPVRDDYEQWFAPEFPQERLLGRTATSSSLRNFART